jgi:hypothetical protein
MSVTTLQPIACSYPGCCAATVVAVHRSLVTAASGVRLRRATWTQHRTGERGAAAAPQLNCCSCYVPHDVCCLLACLLAWMGHLAFCHDKHLCSCSHCSAQLCIIGAHQTPSAWQNACFNYIYIYLVSGALFTAAPLLIAAAAGTC